MIFNETIQGRTERFRRMLHVATNRLQSFLLSDGTGHCRTHGPDQRLSLIRHPDYPTEVPCCTQCLTTFFSAAVEAKPASKATPKTEYFVCNYQTCSNEAVPGTKCCWCGRHYCNAHMDTSACCDECAGQAGEESDDAQRLTDYQRACGGE